MPLGRSSISVCVLSITHMTIEDKILTVIDGLLKHTESLFGYPVFGYWLWHNTDEAADEMAAHVHSPLSSLLNIC